MKLDQACKLPRGSKICFATLESTGQLYVLLVYEDLTTRSSNADDVSVYAYPASVGESDFCNNIEDGAYMEVSSV